MRVTGLGGVCIHGGGSFDDRVIIAWGGVLAQLVLYAAALFSVQLLGPPDTAFSAKLLGALTRWNLIIAALNMIPVEPFDGALAWELPKRWLRRDAGGRAAKKPRARQATKASRKPEERGEVVPPDAESRARELAKKALEDARKR